MMSMRRGRSPALARNSSVVFCGRLCPRDSGDSIGIVYAFGVESEKDRTLFEGEAEIAVAPGCRGLCAPESEDAWSLSPREARGAMHKRDRSARAESMAYGAGRRRSSQGSSCMHCCIDWSTVHILHCFWLAKISSIRTMNSHGLFARLTSAMCGSSHLSSLVSRKSIRLYSLALPSRALPRTSHPVSSSQACRYLLQRTTATKIIAKRPAAGSSSPRNRIPLWNPNLRRLMHYKHTLPS